MYFKLVILKRDPILEKLVADICNETYVTAMECNSTKNEDTSDKEESIMERPRWMSKVRIDRDPMIEALAKLCTPSRLTKRDRKNTTLKKTKSRLSNLNNTSTPSHPTKKSRLSTSHRKSKSRSHKTISQNADGSIIVNSSISRATAAAVLL